MSNIPKCPDVTFIRRNPSPKREAPGCDFVVPKVFSSRQWLRSVEALSGRMKLLEPSSKPWKSSVEVSKDVYIHIYIHIIIVFINIDIMYIYIFTFAQWANQGRILVQIRLAHGFKITNANQVTTLFDECVVYNDWHLAQTSLYILWFPRIQFDIRNWFYQVLLHNSFVLRENTIFGPGDGWHGHRHSPVRMT